MQNDNGIKAGNIAQSEDRRITKTKKKLFDTFISMLGTMSIEDITVNDLCTRAEVRRATFYKHYTDKIDFCSYVLSRNREEFDKSGRAVIPEKYKDDCFVKYAIEYIEFLDANEAIISNLVKSDLITVLTHVVLKQHYNEILYKLNKCVELNYKLTASPSTLAVTIVSTILGIAFNWLQTGRTKPKAEVINEIATVVKQITGCC